MRCPKCDYLGYEAVERCRNCGYEFALSGAEALGELALHPGRRDETQPLVDLDLVDAATADLLGEPQRQGRAAAVASPTPELPLFSSRADDDTPLITRPSPPRPPLAVRRATPEVPRLRQESRPSAFEASLPGLEPAPVEAPARAAIARPVSETAAPVADASPAEPAPLAARGLAMAVDLAVLAAIDAIVVYFTMQICGLTRQDMALLPKVPLVAFLLLQNVSYFVAFTAGGQTLGKMLTGIKVVSDAGATPDLAQALRRTLIWCLLAVPAGLGLLSTMFDAQRRGLHDRVAATRVVRAGA